MSQEVLRIPIPLEALRGSLGDELVDEALEHGERTADAARLSPATGITAAEATAAGYLTVDVVRKMRVGAIYAQRLEMAVSLMDAETRNGYEAALAAQARGDLTVASEAVPSKPVVLRSEREFIDRYGEAPTDAGATNGR